MAVVDLVADDITAIHGLGFKRWEELDASDEDGGECSGGGDGCSTDGSYVYQM